jgi:hypothetical protein
MNEPRPLHEVFGERAHQLAEDRHAALDEAGHPGLPDELLAEAVVSYADTAPAPVAEQLAPFVTAHTAGRFGEPADTGADLSQGLELLASAPAATGTDLDDQGAAGPAPVDGPAASDPDPSAVNGLDFGGGAGNGDQPAPGPEAPPEPSAGTAEPSPLAGGSDDADQFPPPADDPFFDDVARPIPGDGDDAADGDDLSGL